jgi:hypothetical protein
LHGPRPLDTPPPIPLPDHERRTLIASGWPWLGASLCAALGAPVAVAWAMGVWGDHADPRWDGIESRIILVLTLAPVAFAAIAIATLIRTDPPARRSTAMCLGRAACWAVVPWTMITGATAHHGAQALPITLILAFLGAGAFVIRWAMLCDRAELPATRGLDGVQGGVVGVSLVAGLAPVLWPVIVRAVGG